MKKILYVMVLCFVLSSTYSAQAQSLDALLKGLSSLFGVTEQQQQTQPQKPKVTHPEISELIGRWTYDGMTMDYTGDSTLASVAISTLESQLPALATKFGLVAGRDYIEVGEDGMITFVSGESKISAHCTYYDSYDGQADMVFYVDGKSVSLSAIILQQDGKTKILFNANKLMNLMQQHYSKFNENTTLQMAKTVIDSYPGIRVGAFVKR